MDIEKICASLRVLPTTEELLTAEKALYALQAENEKLRTELEKEAAARKKQADILCELRGQKYEQMSVIDRLRSELNDLRAQWDMYGGDVGITATFSELEKVKRERDAAVDCIYKIEDALDRGNDNDWAREHISEWESQKEG
jgi:predicted nuclease with TOPRIM domain